MLVLFKPFRLMIFLGLGAIPAVAQIAAPQATSRAQQLAQCRDISEPTARRKCYLSLRHRTSKAKTMNPQPAAVPQATAPLSTPDEPTTTSTPDEPTTTGTIAHSDSVGRPLCEDEEELKAMLIAEILASTPEEASTKGCQILPGGSQIEIIERYPSRFYFFQIVKVKVASRNPANSMVGYTIDIGR
jgi:hypothetical protein